MKQLEFPKKVIVSEHTTLLRNLSKSQKKFYLGFLNKLIKIYKKAGKKRVVVALCGPTGSGKSVLAELTRQLAKQRNLKFSVQQISQDGYHFPNSYLRSHLKNKRTLKEFKGRYDTYDVVKLKKHLKMFLNGKNITFPGYSRKTHEPFKEGVKISESNVLLLVEGIWLLYDKGRWKSTSKLFDYSFYIKADKNKVKSKVIERLRRGGRTLKSAKKHYDESDAKNFDLIEKSSVNVNKILKPYYKIK
mgnify:CR=1 FL=1